MKKISLHVLRLGLAITFLWLGILILRQPNTWSGYLQPWAASLSPIPIETTMTLTAVTDITIGLLLLFDVLVWPAALVAVIHLIIILIVTGITDITIRDVAILGAALALLIEVMPQSRIKRIFTGLFKN